MPCRRLQLGASPHITPTLIWPHARALRAVEPQIFAGCARFPQQQQQQQKQQHNRTWELTAEAYTRLLTFLKTSTSGISWAPPLSPRRPLFFRSHLWLYCGQRCSSPASLPLCPMQMQQKKTARQQTRVITFRAFIRQIDASFVLLLFFSSTSPPSRRAHFRERT